MTQVDCVKLTRDKVISAKYHLASPGPTATALYRFFSNCDTVIPKANVWGCFCENKTLSNLLYRIQSLSFSVEIKLDVLLCVDMQNLIQNCQNELHQTNGG